MKCLFFTVLLNLWICCYAFKSDSSCDWTYDKLEHETPNNTMGTCSCQKSPKTCSIKFEWDPPSQSKPKEYLITIEAGDDSRRYCFKVSNTTTSFLFDKDNGWKDGIKFGYGYFVIELPTNKDLGPIYNNVLCPDPISVSHDLPRGEIYVNESYTFQCSFEGNPLPEPNEIDWKFNGSKLNKNSTHFEIVTNKGYSSLTIINAQKEHTGSYICIGRNYFGKEDNSEGYLYVKEKPISRSPTNLGLIIVVVFGSCVLLAAVLYALTKYSRSSYSEKVLKRFSVDEKKLQVYVSHCSNSDAKRMTLLKFLNQLTKSVPTLDVVVDLTRETAISKAGGLPQWIPDSLSKADIFLVVLSGDYVKILKDVIDKSDTSGMTQKVHSEYLTIHKILYQKGCVKNACRLIILNADLKGDMLLVENIPEYFRGRPIYKLPSDLVLHTNDFNKIVSLFTVSKNKNVCENAV